MTKIVAKSKKFQHTLKIPQRKLMEPLITQFDDQMQKKKNVVKEVIDINDTNNRLKNLSKRSN